VNEIRAVKASPNIFLKTAVINNKKIKCLLDTGSDCTIMKLSVARKVKAVIHESETNTTRRCFLGNVIASNQKCEVQIEIEEAIVSVTATVLEDQYLRHDIIIGRDYLCNEDVLLTKTRDKLSPRSLPPFDIGNIESEDNAPSCLKLETIHFAKELPPNQKMATFDLLQEYRDCIAFSMRELGKTNSIEMHIRCTTDEWTSRLFTGPIV
jgi:hypothetical protein